MHRDGRPIDVALSVTSLVDPDTGTVVGGIASHRDIAEQIRAQAARAKVEQERREIAQELHDELGQCVTAIRTIAESLVQRPALAAPDVRSAAQSIKDIAARIYEGMHAIARRLRPAELDALGLAETLRATLGAWASRNPGIAFRLDLEGDIDSVRDPVSTTVYRLVHEALTNVVRHAGAKRAAVRVARGDDRTLVVAVDDDGHGQVSRASAAVGLGLAGMAERVEALGGSLSVDGRPGVGTTVRATIPLSRA